MSITGTPLGSGVNARVVTALPNSGNMKLSIGAVIGIVLVSLLIVVGAGLAIRHYLVVTRVRRAQKRTAWKRRLENRLSQVRGDDGTGMAAAPPAQAAASGAEDIPRL